MSREPTTPGDDNLDRLLTMSADPPTLDPDARARLLARLQRSVETDISPVRAPEKAPGGPVPMPPRRRPRLSSIVANSLGLAVAGSFVWIGVDLLRGEQAGSSASQVAVYHNEGARPQVIALADGSTAILRAGAEIREVGSRTIELVGGEVLLDVVPREGAFTVASPAGDVEVRGTKFVLRHDAGSRELFAGVLRGEVRLASAGGEAVLQAGEAASMSPGTAPARRPAPRLSHEVQWARDAIVDPTDELKAVRRGNLLARFPNWPGEFPLPVRTMDVDVVVENGVARTTIDQTFFNETPYELEGVYSFPLPADAAISRLAMYVDGKRMEAGVTERQEGRTIYESIVYRRRDPALLEWMQGNEFRVRIFPLPGRTEKRILLSYTQPLSSLYGDYSVRVPIPELDRPVGTVRYRVHVKDPSFTIDSCCVEFKITEAGDGRLAEATMRDVMIGEDLALTLYPRSAPPAVTVAAQPDPGGDYVMVRARPSLPQSSEHTPRRWVVLHDTSASRSPAELAAQTRFLRAALRELDEADRVTLLAFDSTVRALPGGFTRVDALDPDDVAAFLAAAGRDHVGATELGRALDEALALLAADDGAEAPHILYVGDGLASARSDAERAELRARLAGKATFVAAAVGDEVDLDLLDDLAAATGGLRVQLTAGADLRWQALDLAAALNTARLQDVRATLLGDGDVPIAARTHLSASSLADGEALVVMSRKTGSSGPDPKVMVIEGTLAGAPWSQRVELPAATKGAGYLPRLWARAQIAADVRAGAEAHKDEITALGLEHFLVTPFTSLLVLEDEAMYRQFKVRRPSAQDWAHYAAPDEIEVVREPIGAVEPAPGQIVQRRPLPLISDPRQHQQYRALSGEWSRFGSDDADVWGGLTGTEIGQAFGVGGLGLIGTGRGGGGTGEGTIGLGNLGVIGFGGRGTPRDSARTQADVPTQEPVTGASVTERRGPSFVTTADLRNKETSRWQRTTTAAGATQATTKWSGLSTPERATRGHSLYYSGVRAQPVALHHVGDIRLGDLGEHVPALFEDDFDRERERLIATSLGAPAGSISPVARQLLETARAAVKPAQYSAGGGLLRVEADGRFARERTIGGYLREVVVYDGDTLTAHYPDLDLAVERRAGLVEPALLAQWVPWMLPSPDALARWYDVDTEDERTLSLALRGGEDVVLLRLDERHRLVAVEHRRGETALGELRFEYDDKGLTIVAGSERTRVDLAEGAPNLAGIDAVATTLKLPLRGDADLVRLLAEQTPGSAEWRQIQRQRLAVLSALGRHWSTQAVFAEIRKHGKVTRGELVLGGAGLVQAPEEAAAALGELRGDPVAAYIAALRGLRRGKTGPLEQVAKASRGTLVGLLASHARLLADASRGPTAPALERLRAFLTTYDQPELAYSATHQLAGVYWRKPEQGAKAWELLAELAPRWRPVALHAAGTAYWYAGKRTEATERFERSLAAAIDGGQAPPIDWTVRSAVQQTRGQAGWRVQWNRWRAAVQRSGDGEQLIAFLAAAQQLGEAGEIHRVLVGADLGRLAPEVAGELALLLVQGGQTSDAQQVLRGALARLPDDPGLLGLAATIAEQQGRLAEAAELAERALQKADQLPLGQLRQAYRRIFQLRARLAESIVATSGQDAKDMSRQTGVRAPVDVALDVAARWRAEDPDNAEIDELCATLLFTLGYSAEALRHLDSIVERHPGEGDAYAKVAALLEREGRLADADRRWQQAAAAEPTNPTWLVGRAHNLIAAGDTAGARALAQQVERGKWQDRFFAAVADARELARQLDATRP